MALPFSPHKIRLLGICCWLISLWGIQVHAATFTVSNLADSGPGSFRSALVSANFSAGADIIVFSVAGNITLGSALPGIADPVNINGRSAPGYVACGGPVISINGGGIAANGLQFLGGASGSTISALNIRNFSFNGIQLISANNCTIQNCYIGTNLAGTSANANGQNGIQIEGGTNNALVGGTSACTRNIISGNVGFGVSINGSSTNTISGNFIGVDISGSAMIPNNAGGVLMVAGGNSNILGGSLAGERNIISGNGAGLTGNGINIDGQSNCIIRGNYVGLNAAGTAALGNAENGISLNGAPGTIVGGTGAFDGNVIADHNFHAMVLNGGSNACEIAGNFCGTNAAGTIAFGNDDSGIIVINSDDVIIGGNTAGHRNILSGSLSEYGIFLINADRTIVHGNYIGTDISGAAPLPNFDGGIRVDFGSTTAQIGGDAAGEGNIIAFNTGYGVGVLSSGVNQNLISRNSMFCNTGKGIDLNGVGNANHPSPVFTTFSTTGCAGTSQANNIIEIFYDSLCVATCQGKDYIATVTADGAGNWSYTGPLIGGATLVATARDVPPPPGAAENTSEFSCVVILPVEGLTLVAEPLDGGTVLLNWATTREENTAFFEVESSLSGADFLPIGRVDAQGNAPDGASYDWLDASHSGGTVYYRLRQVDLNGDFTFSEVVKIEPADFPAVVSVYPQPADGFLRIELAGIANEISGVELIDLRGGVVKQDISGLDASALYFFSVEDVPAGIYFLRIQLHGRPAIIQKIRVQHR